MNRAVIWAVESLALVVVGDGPLATARRQPADATVTMFAGDQEAFPIECQAIAPTLLAIGTRSCETGGFEKHR